MDINYHYFAVKTLAKEAGFEEAPAQTLAAYSQMVDDYNLEKPVKLAQVPDYARHLAEKTGDGYVFYPATTGFCYWYDTARLILPARQKAILTPFHFICRQPLNQAAASRDIWRVTPERMSGGGLLAPMLDRARTGYRSVPEGQLKHFALLRIGQLLHIMADTYAHQNFSGQHGWENHARLTTVVDNITGQDITSQFNPGFYHLAPSVGHANVSTAPDESRVTFGMSLKRSENDNYTLLLNRSNTDLFLDCSLIIINYLFSCRAAPQWNPNSPRWWQFRDRLRQGLMVSGQDPKRLAEHWGRIFPENQYHYSAEPLKTLLQPALQANDPNGLDESAIWDYVQNPNDDRFIMPLFEVRSEDFFHYNVYAREIVDIVNGQPTQPVYSEAIRAGLAGYLEHNAAL
jgi:hypothetical protein